MRSPVLSLVLVAFTVGLCSAQLDTCPNEVPAECPTNSSVTGCSTCCCTSSDNVEFYVPSMGEPSCTALPAVYEVAFHATWTASCHPDYYFSSAHWSPLTGISHKPEYELWDACMHEVSSGVAKVSQTGSTSTINQEYQANADNVLDTYTASIVIPGAGTFTGQLDFDNEHQYVSLVTMLAPSVDRMMGVSSVRLCNGSEWKQFVRLCGELFSTATKSERVSDDRNSIQFNNCSFGYFDFTLISVEEPPTSSVMPSPSSVIAENTPVPTAVIPDSSAPATTVIPDGTPSAIPVATPQTPDSSTCLGIVPAECPAVSSVTGCSTCCCASSDNVEFYSPSMGEPSCTAPDAVYQVRFVSTWTESCQPDYYFSSAHWSPLTGISHKPEYELWDACMYDVSPGVATVSQTGGTYTINQEYKANAAYVLDTFTSPFVIGGADSDTQQLDFDRDHQYVSVVTMLAPSVDRMMGVSSVRLCDGSEWKSTVKLCGELFSTATKSARVSEGRNSIQFNNCSFGYFEFNLLSVEEPPTTDASVCGGTVPECASSPPESVTMGNCPTCCCSSSNNVEFYQPSNGEPSCSAPDAVYEVKLAATWTQACHPNYYLSNPHWSALTGISHTPDYELWDACMHGVSPGVALVSQTGSTSVINQEYTANSAYVLDTFTARTIPAAANITAELDLDSSHQYVSVVSMLAPSKDQMIGVSLLRLCDGTRWRQSVKLCAELFSTATKTERVSDGRNSIQYNNCSFGYFEFTLLRVDELNTIQASPASSGNHLTGSFVHFLFCQMLLVLITKLVLR